VFLGVGRLAARQQASVSGLTVKQKQYGVDLLNVWEVRRIPIFFQPSTAA
jgi:hypothetical protein